MEAAVARERFFFSIFMFCIHLYGFIVGLISLIVRAQHKIARSGAKPNAKLNVSLNKSAHFFFFSLGWFITIFFSVGAFFVSVCVCFISGRKQSDVFLCVMSVLLLLIFFCWAKRVHLISPSHHPISQWVDFNKRVDIIFFFRFMCVFRLSVSFLNESVWWGKFIKMISH